MKVKKNPDGEGTYKACIMCPYRETKEDEPYDPDDRPVIKEITWDTAKDSFPLSFELLKKYSVAGVIGSLLVWDGKEAAGEPVAEGEITSKNSVVTEGGESNSVKTTGEVEWKFGDPGEYKEVTVGVKAKKPGDALYSEGQLRGGGEGGRDCP